MYVEGLTTGTTKRARSFIICLFLFQLAAYILPLQESEENERPSMRCIFARQRGYRRTTTLTGGFKPHHHQTPWQVFNYFLVMRDARYSLGRYLCCCCESPVPLLSLLMYSAGAVTKEILSVMLLP